MLEIIKLLTWAAMPTGIFTLGILLALILLALRFKRVAVTFIVLSTIQLFAFSLKPVSDALLIGLENQARELDAKNNLAQQILSNQKYAAIVLLGGGVSGKYPPSKPHPDLNEAGDRLLHAARLFKKVLAPKIIVSGGRIPGLERAADVQNEAQAMREILLEIGIPDSAIVVEELSRTTRENAEKTKEITKGAKVALVTSAFHMPRSARTFRKYGLEFDTFSTDFRVSAEPMPWWVKWFPRASALQDSETALKEYIALAINY